MLRSRCLLLSSLAVASCGSVGLRAQQIAPEPTGVRPCALAPTGLWRAPIHTLDTDPVGGAYGFWAAGDDYKVSFHDGFTFYPFVGAEAENQPVRWVTEAITAGGEPIADLAASRQAHTDWRYEYHYGRVTEAYDVRDDGVEQTFVLHRPPAHAGDVVVCGRFATALQPAMPAGEAGIVLLAADRPLVRYGSAWARDAAGRRTPVAIGLDGKRVRLVVPGSWLAGAVYPVTIDPLTSRVAISFSGRPDFTALFHEDESPTNNTLVSYARQFSASDYDLYARLGDGSLASTVQVYTDVTASWSTVFPDETFVGAADRWLLTFWRQFTTGETRVRVYFHDKANTSLNSGTTAFHDPAAGEHDSFPSLGGRRNPNPGSGNTALLTYRADPYYGNSPTSVVWGVLVDAATRTIATLRVQISRPNLDAEAPDVNSVMGWNDDAWVVVYEGTNGAPDDYDVYVARVSNYGALLADIYVGPDPGGDKTRPVVEGRDGRYLVAMLADPAPEYGGQRWARNIWTERFDWISGMAAPIKYGPRLLRSDAAQDISHLRLAFDATTTSHWCLVYQADSVSSPVGYAERLGSHGYPTESVQLDGGAPGRYHPSVAWNAAAREFPIVFCSTEATQPVYAQTFQYPASATNVSYGSGCAPGSYSFTALAPYAGSEFFSIRLSGLPAGQLLVLALSLQAANLSLLPAGMPGCTLLVDPNAPSFLGTFLTLTTTSTSVFPLPLPDHPLFQQDLFAQALVGWPGLNALGLATTSGLQMHVR
ncbi:MAG TPA: hypothetical protein VFZ65_06200 [Planctomycetota bacterium]|nr:hypothetical protein [Planctomycetota bacterium]